MPPKIGTDVIRARLERAVKLREALRLEPAEVLAGVREILGESAGPRKSDYKIIYRWFSDPTRGPSDAALTWLEMRAREKKLEIARRVSWDDAAKSGRRMAVR